MAKRKSTAAPKSAAARTTASVFIDGSADLDVDSTPSVVPADKTAMTASGLEVIPDDTKLPFKLLYQFQDLLNDNLTLAKGVQILVCLYLTQILYLYFTKNGYEDAMYSICFNILGGVLAIYLSHRSQNRKHEMNPELNPAPTLPEFNTIYSLFIPIVFIAYMSDYEDSFFQANLALSNFAIKSLHPVAKVVSSFVFYYMYNDSATLELFQFMKVIWVYYSVDAALNAWNESIVTREDGEVIVSTTLSNTEIHLIAMACVNILGHLELIPLTPTSTPLFILRVLILALIIACAVTYPMYEGIKKLGPGMTAEALSFVVVGIFAACFYFATNYQFDLFVAKEEVLHWLYNYVMDSPTRVKLLSTWLLILAVAIPVMFILSKSGFISLNLRRKAWHFILVASLTTPLVSDSQFTTLAVLGSVIVFVVFEFLRCTELTFLGKWLNKELRYFQDEKDLAGPLNLSYIFLLAGVGIPLAYDAAVGGSVSIRSYLGLATLGLGDSVASIVGKRFGKTKWRGSDKSFEGTVAYVIATLAYFVFVDFFVLPEANRVTNWENVFIVALVSGIVEGTASLNDNVLVPTISLIAYEGLERVFPGQ